MVEGQVFLKRTGRGGGPPGWGLALFLFKFLFAELRYAFEAKLFFSATIILWKKKKIILSFLKIDLKIFHQLRKPDLFAKGFKKLKIDFW